jgi:hypothetical protein
VKEDEILDRTLATVKTFLQNFLQGNFDNFRVGARENFERAVKNFHAHVARRLKYLFGSSCKDKRCGISIRLPSRKH